MVKVDRGDGRGDRGDQDAQIDQMVKVGQEDREVDHETAPLMINVVAMASATPTQACA